MKRGLLVSLVALAAASSCRQDRPPPPVFDERHVIVVEGAAVRYNGQLLDWTAPPERWQQVLGPRSRVVRGISVWDDLGVFVFHNRSRDLRPDSFVVLLGRARHSQLTETEPDYWPRQAFGGRLMVDGALVHKDSTLLQINRDKKGPAFQRGHIATEFRYDVDGADVSLGFGHDRSLTSFSISPRLPEP